MDDDDDNNYIYDRVISLRCLRPQRELRKQCFATNSWPGEIPGDKKYGGLGEVIRCNSQQCSPTDQPP